MANGLELENFKAYSINETTNSITYSCDISWDNSWKNERNNDAVWVFLKHSIDGGATWSRARMGSSGTDPVGFSAPYGFEIIVPSDKMGFFIQRTDRNSGDVSAEGVRFVWDYGQDNLTDEVAAASNTVNKIFGIEMVYVPEGAFFAGDGASSSEYRFVEGSSDSDPFYITGEEEIKMTNSAQDGYYYQSTGATGESSSGEPFIISTSFPKGYQAFYQMKYELTEGQWVGFFNTLSEEEKVNRDITSLVEGGKNQDGVVDRNTVSWISSNPKSDATTLRPDRPVSYVSWPDVAAYADWSGLRPMTEFEYEKSARGKNVDPITDEFAWGTASAHEALSGEIYPSGSDEDGTEQLSGDDAANINRNDSSWGSGDGRSGGIADGQKGPLRAGIFAESSTGRTTSGAGYYGSMELSGNLHEMVVTIGRPEGRRFLGEEGDGILSSVSGYEGNATNSDWPGINSIDSARGVTGTVGSGYRGGDFQSPSLRHFQISSRTFAVKDADSQEKLQRYDAQSGIFQGGRLVRTAP